MFCVTFMIKEGGSRQDQDDGYLCSPQTAKPGINLSLCANYDNCVRNTLEYMGYGIVGNYVRHERCHRNLQVPDGCGYYKAAVRAMKTPDARSFKKTRNGQKWQMTVSMVVSGGRMWFIVDGVLYDPQVELMLTDDTHTVLPGTLLDGNPEDFLVPLFKSTRHNLITLVKPDATFRDVNIPLKKDIHPDTYFESRF